MITGNGHMWRVKQLVNQHKILLEDFMIFRVLFDSKFRKQEII